MSDKYVDSKLMDLERQLTINTEKTNANNIKMTEVAGDVTWMRSTFGTSLQKIEQHLSDLNGQVAKNSKFRYESKIWFSIIAFLAVAASGVLNSVLINFLTN